MVLHTNVPAWRWFWGTEEQPDSEEAKRLLNNFDVCISSPESLLVIHYDKINMVAYPHIYVSPEGRNKGIGIALIRKAEEVARADGMRKILAQIPGENPFFVVGEKHRLGYTLEGELKDHFLIDGKAHSLFLYGKLLQQNDSFNKKE